MSGSRRWFAYFTDDGTEFALQLDESVAESVSLGFGQSITGAVAADPGRRINPSRKGAVQPRYVLASRIDTDGREVRRKFYVGALSGAAWGGSPYGVTIDGDDWDITFRSGEKRSFIPASDTGIIDGDVDSNITTT